MELNGNNENIFVDGKFVYIKRNNKTFKYDKSFKVVECYDFIINKQIGSNLYTLDSDNVKKYMNLQDINDCKIETTYVGQDIVDFYNFRDSFVYINSKDELYKDKEGFLGYTIKSPYKFFGSFVYFLKNRNLVKLDLINLTLETIKMNIKPTLIEVFDNLIVLNVNGVVQIISKNVNMTFHKHSSKIQSVIRVDDYLYFVCKDNKLSVAELNRDVRKYLFEFIGEFKQMVVIKNCLYILTDIEIIVFDLIKSKCRSFTFNLPIYESFSRITKKEDLYFDMVTAVYKEKKVKTEVEPFYKIINSNKYKVEEQVYTFKNEMVLDNTIEYAFIFRNILFIYDMMSKNVLKVFKMNYEKLYFSDNYLFSLKNSGIDIYKYRDNKLRRLFRREIECEKVPENVYFYNNTLYYQIDDRIYKTSIVLKKLEIHSGVKYMKDGVAIDDKGAYSVVTSKYLSDLKFDNELSENGVIQLEGSVLKELN